MAKKPNTDTPEVVAPILPEAPAPTVAKPSVSAKPLHAATTRAQEHKAKLMAALAAKFKALLKDKLGIDADPTSDVIEVNGKTFTIHGSSLFVFAPCPKCGMKVQRVEPVTAESDIDAVIKKSAVAYHYCVDKPVVAAAAPAK